LTKRFKIRAWLSVKACALRRYHICDPRLEQAYQIELALTDNCAVRFNQGSLDCPNQKRTFPFRNSGVSGEFSILPRPLRLQKTTAERNHFSDVVANRNIIRRKTIVIRLWPALSDPLPDRAEMRRSPSSFHFDESLAISSPIA